MTDSDIFTARIRATQHAINIGRIARYLATIELGERPFDHPVIDVLNKAINAAYVDPKMKARLADTGGAVLPGTPTEFGMVLAQEIEKWARVVKASGMKPE